LKVQTQRVGVAVLEPNKGYGCRRSDDDDQMRPGTDSCPVFSPCRRAYWLGLVKVMRGLTLAWPGDASPDRRCRQENDQPKRGDTYARGCSPQRDTLIPTNSSSTVHWPKQKHVPRQPKPGLPDRWSSDDLRGPRRQKDVSRRAETSAEKLVSGFHSRNVSGLSSGLGSSDLGLCSFSLVARGLWD
jgi:hypothetical protein